MKRNFLLFQQYIAYALLVSLFLQSCVGTPNPLIPIKEEQTPFIQTDVQAIIPQIDTQHLVGQELIAQGGHSITLYEEAGKPKADVVLNTPQGFSKSYKGLAVYVEQGAQLASLPLLGKLAQERRIHLQLTQGEYPARVMIYKSAGLMGGMKCEDDPQEKEKDDDLQDKSILNDFFVLSLGKL